MVGSVAGLRAGKPFAGPVREPALDGGAVGAAMGADRVQRVAAVHGTARNASRR